MCRKPDSDSTERHAKRHFNLFALLVLFANTSPLFGVNDYTGERNNERQKRINSGLGWAGELLHTNWKCRSWTSKPGKSLQPCDPVAISWLRLFSRHTLCEKNPPCSFAIQNPFFPHLSFFFLTKYNHSLYFHAQHSAGQKDFWEQDPIWK